MDKSLHSLRGANQPSRAADVNFALLCDGFGTAFGAMVGECKSGPINVPRQIVDDLRDDVMELESQVEGLRELLEAARKGDR
jgi:hypothetical protein